MVLSAIGAAQPTFDDLMAIFTAPDKTAMDDLLTKAQSRAQSHPRWMGMAGYASATLADHEWTPTAKLKRFNQGKDQLEKAISTDPNDPVLRLMRLMIQLECPFFLGFRSEIDIDLDRLAAELTNPKSAWPHGFKYKTLSYLANHKELSREQKALFKNATL